MRILMLTRFYKPKVGGVEKHIEKVSQVLLKKGHKISVVATKHIPTLNDQERLKGIEVIRHKPWEGFVIRRNISLLRWVLANRHIFAKADLFHGHDTYYWPLKILFPKKPFHITFHGYEGYPIKKKAIFVRKIFEKIARGNICVGIYLKKYYGTKPDFIIYGGVDLPKKFDYPVRYDAVFMGRLEEEAGILIYLKALKILNEQHHLTLKIVICGDGKLRRDCEEFSQKNKLEAIFTGFIPSSDDYLKYARFSFASNYLAIYEAAARKKLIFSVYGNQFKKEILESLPRSEKTLILSDSPDSLALKILYYFHHSEKARIITEEAYNWVKNQTWEKVADLYLRLWRL